jgi:hypothetical protein|uniref:Agenet-like domain-containing protein n=1 Tax=Fagus sylvatica TaxID=28930 RepID=A0A2N9IBM0_FAGSY
MMRFYRGSRIEVLDCRVARPVGAWSCAEVTKLEDDRGEWFSVKYRDGRVENFVRISCIRPCPPPLEFVGELEPGDLAEFCVSYNWITTTVLKALDDDNYMVRQLGGDYKEFVINRAILRVPQDWREGKWSVIQSNFTKYRIQRHGFSSYLRKIWMRPSAKRTPCVDFSPIKKRRTRHASSTASSESCVIDSDDEEENNGFVGGTSMRMAYDDDDTISVASSVGSCCSR